MLFLCVITRTASSQSRSCTEEHRQSWSCICSLCNRGNFSVCCEYWFLSRQCDTQGFLCVLLIILQFVFCENLFKGFKCFDILYVKNIFWSFNNFLCYSIQKIYLNTTLRSFKIFVSLNLLHLKEKLEEILRKF